MKIKGSSVLLTGASGGIGQAIAHALHRRGAKLTITGRNAAVLEDLAKATEAKIVVADLTDRTAVAELSVRASETDILVANAGLPAAGDITGFSVEEIDRAIDVNLRASILLGRAAAGGMAARGRGHILFMSSLAGKVAPTGSSLYSATKFGLRGFALALREDLRDSRVGVSVIFPGFISDAGMFADAGVKLPRGVGTKRPEDVANAVIRAIEVDRAQIDVAPLGLKVGTLVGTVAPGIAAAFSRRAGAHDTAAAFTEGQRDKR